MTRLDQEFISLKKAKKIVKKLSIEETFVKEEEEEDEHQERMFESGN